MSNDKLNEKDKTHTLDLKMVKNLFKVGAFSITTRCIILHRAYVYTDLLFYVV